MGLRLKEEKKVFLNFNAVLVINSSKMVEFRLF